RTAEEAGAPAVPPDEQKTKVLRRDELLSRGLGRAKTDANPPSAPQPAIGPVTPQPQVPLKPQPQVPAPPAPSKFRYCPACTTANPPGATVCRGCGNPLGGGETPQPLPAPTPWACTWRSGLRRCWRWR